LEEEKIKYIILTEDITKDEKLTDKEKNIYAMILALSKKLVENYSVFLYNYLKT